jgi:hypothetical protein
MKKAKDMTESKQEQEASKKVVLKDELLEPHELEILNALRAEIVRFETVAGTLQLRINTCVSLIGPRYMKKDTVEFTPDRQIIGELLDK